MYGIPRADREKNLRTRSRESLSRGEVEVSHEKVNDMRIRGNRIDCLKTIVGHFSLLGRLFIPWTRKGARDHLALAFHAGRRTMSCGPKESEAL